MSLALLAVLSFMLSIIETLQVFSKEVGRPKNLELVGLNLRNRIFIQKCYNVR